VADPVRYHVDLSDRVHHLVRVTLTIPAELTPGARVVLPVWTPGSYVVRDYVHHVQWIEARDGDGTPIELTPDGGSAWRLPATAPGPVEVQLELYANELTVRTNHVDDHHALLIPAATFPYVEGGEDRRHIVHLPAVPDDHRVWSLLPAGPEPDTFVADDRDHLIDSAFEVGDLPHVDFEVAGVPHRFVWAGHAGAPNLDRIARETAAIGRAAMRLFEGELPTERYTLLMVGWDEGGGGLEHRDGAVLQMPVRTFQDADMYARFQSLIAHEYLHLWNVKRLVPAALVNPDYDRPTRSPSLWVAEGWTAYYDELLPLRAGLWTLRRFLDTLRDAHGRLVESPGSRLQSLRQASYEAWTKHYVRDENSPNAMTDYYGHGALVAFEVDLRLRALDPHGDGLDGVLRLLWERHADDVDGYTEDDVLAAIADIGGAGMAELVDQRVGTPGLPELEDAVEAVGLRWDTTNGPVPPHLGVHITEDDRGVTFGSVLRDGPAWRAGLTGGDRLIAIDGRTVAPGTVKATLLAFAPGVEVELAVTRGPRLLQRTVTLGEPVPIRTLALVDDPRADQRAAFTRWTGLDWPDS
jgi:predicted metalloprotease with PDZ domain